MINDLVRVARAWDENGPPEPPFFATGKLLEAMADRIEELEAKLEKATLAFRTYCLSVQHRKVASGEIPAAQAPILADEYTRLFIEGLKGTTNG